MRSRCYRDTYGRSRLGRIVPKPGLRDRMQAVALACEAVALACEAVALA
jgi:hypothetical protein